MTTEDVTIKIDMDSIYNIPHYKQRCDYRMKQEPSTGKLQLKAILDQWVACTISVEDAENQLRDLFATQPDSVDVHCGGLEIKSQTGLCYDTIIKIDGLEVIDCRKLVLTVESGRKANLVMERNLYRPNTEGPKQ